MLDERLAEQEEMRQIETASQPTTPVSAQPPQHSLTSSLSPNISAIIQTSSPSPIQQSPSPSVQAVPRPSSPDPVQALPRPSSPDPTQASPRPSSPTPVQVSPRPLQPSRFRHGRLHWIPSRLSQGRFYQLLFTLFISNWKCRVHRSLILSSSNHLLI